MLTLAAPFALEQEVKRSRFIALAARADTPDEALAHVAAVRRADATHNCWAYRIGDLYRFNDDGEPGGTAGRPILAAIDGQGLDGVAVVVVRYFGGIKLGAGGLARAYGGTASQCLRAAPRIEIVPRAVVLIDAPFDATGAVYPLLERFAAIKRSERFHAAGTELVVDLPVPDLPAFLAAVADATSGRARACEEVPESGPPR
jgi:uncharacterized YigZ family protein